MAELRARWRTVAGCVLTIAIVIYAISDWGSVGETRQRATSEDAEAASGLRITAISDGEVNPGDAVVVGFAGADPSRPIEAKVAKRPAEIVVREQGSAVVRIPAETPAGKASLRLVQGDKHSKAWDLHVRPTNHRKLVARLLGGLALFVLGLGLLALGVRGLAGQGIRALLARLTGSPPRAVGIGALVGAVTQLTSSAAALTVSLVDARMLATGPAIGVLVGAQLGASLTGALLPIQLARESLLVIAIGVLWTRAATSRGGVARANLVLGTGLILYGLHLLQSSIEPLVSDPKLLPYLGYLRAGGVAAALTCAASGAILAFVLQGPGPVYILVIGLAQTTGALPLANALAILAGTNLGAALGMAVVTWQSGTESRPLTPAHLAFGAAASVLVLGMIPLWSAISTALASTPRDALMLGFACAQVAAVALWLPALPALTARATRLRSRARTHVVAPDAYVEASLRELGRIFERQRFAIGAALETSCSSERKHTAECDAALVEARRELESRYRSVSAAPAGPDAERLAQTLVASLQLQRAVEQVVQTADLGVERSVRLTDDEKARLTAIQKLTRESFDALIAALEHGGSPDLEDAGAREIRMNVLEAEVRKLSAVRTHKKRVSTSAFRLGIAELVDTYENVGNHLFRVANALAGEGEDLY